jgi:hypothetical protein
MRKLKILVTGATRQHCGAPHQLNYALTTDLLVQGLRAIGHQIDQRTVCPGEKLRGRYDQAVVLPWNPEARNAVNLYGALWALCEFPDAVMMFDDWNLGTCFTNTRRVVRDPSLLTKPDLTRNHRDEVRPYVARLIEPLVKLLDGRGYRVMVPLFPWCDVSKLRKFPNPELIRWFDPTPMVLPLYRNLRRPPDAARERCWVSGALTRKGADWHERQRLTWPVESYGCRVLQQPRLQELDLVKRYGAVEGVLSFRTSLAGSGWFRLRIVHAAVMGCVLAGDPTETMAIGAPYHYRPIDIENLPLKSRRELAHEQAALFARSIWTKRQLIERLDALVREQPTKGRKAA